MSFVKCWPYCLSLNELILWLRVPALLFPLTTTCRQVRNDDRWMAGMISVEETPNIPHGTHCKQRKHQYITWYSLQTEETPNIPHGTHCKQRKPPHISHGTHCKQRKPPIYHMVHTANRGNPQYITWYTLQTEETPNISHGTHCKQRKPHHIYHMVHTANGEETPNISHGTNCK